MNQLSTVGSPFVLAYLASAKLLNLSKYGTPAPGSDQRVNRMELATTELVAALYELRERGAISLELKKSKVLFITTTSAAVARTGTAPAVDGTLGRVYAATERAKRVEDAVRAFYPKKVDDPAGVVIDAAHAEALAAGAIVVAEKSVSVAARAGLQAAVDAFAARWNAWAQADPDLHKHVVKEASAGITMMETPDSDSDTGSSDSSGGDW